MFIEVHRYSQFTCQAGTGAESSLTPSVALLVHPSAEVRLSCQANTWISVLVGLFLVFANQVAFVLVRMYLRGLNFQKCPGGIP